MPIYHAKVLQDPYILLFISTSNWFYSLVWSSVFCLPEMTIEQTVCQNKEKCGPDADSWSQVIDLLACFYSNPLFWFLSPLCKRLQKKAVCCHVDIHHNTSGVYELDKKAGLSWSYDLFGSSVIKETCICKTRGYINSSITVFLLFSPWHRIWLIWFSTAWVPAGHTGSWGWRVP